MVEAPTSSEWLRWIVLFPLLAALLHGVLLAVVRRALPRAVVAAISCGAPMLSFLIAALAFFQLRELPEGQHLLVDQLYLWIGSGRLSVDLAFHYDSLAAALTLVVTFVGSLIHVYSVGYMDDDERDDGGFQRFFCYLNLFTASMLVLVLGDSLPVVFLGWEGVGLCSYLLIGFWYRDTWNAYCGSKAFIVNRIGDLGFLVGTFLLFSALLDSGAASLDFRAMEAAIGGVAERTVAVPSFLPGAPTWKLTTLIGLCFFLGACGKSAQIPLYIWLPDAMAGPTPVSALIHAATMVTAGVYLICRLHFVYELAPGAGVVIAWTGAATALLAAVLAVAQTDIKKVLAYSTVSQLGYMFMAVGVGAYGSAMFHVYTHAFFKALLFMAAGAVILSLHHEQDLRRMGGLKSRLFWTHWVFLIGVLAIVGFPLLSGFFSKDEILLEVWAADHVPGHRILWAVGVGTAALTAFYMFRLYFLAFRGKTRVAPELRDRLVEPGLNVMVPLYVLAGFAVFGGLAGLPQMYGDMLEIPESNSFRNFLGHVVPTAEHGVSHGTELALAGAAIAALGLGFLVARWLYVVRPELPERIAQRSGLLYRALRDKLWVDEVYDALIVRPLVFVSERVLYRGVDVGLIDGIFVDGTARGVRALAARGLKYLHPGLAQGYLLSMAAGTFLVVVWLLR